MGRRSPQPPLIFCIIECQFGGCGAGRGVLVLRADWNLIVSAAVRCVFCGDSALFAEPVGAVGNSALDVEPVDAVGISARNVESVGAVVCGISALYWIAFDAVQGREERRRGRGACCPQCGAPPKEYEARGLVRV
jgi:hypothetical protein